jgi:F-box domain
MADNSDRPSKVGLLSLPDELLLEITADLDLKSLLALRSTCHRFEHMIDFPALLAAAITDAREKVQASHKLGLEKFHERISGFEPATMRADMQSRSTFRKTLAGVSKLENRIKEHLELLKSIQNDYEELEAPPVLPIRAGPRRGNKKGRRSAYQNRMREWQRLFQPRLGRQYDRGRRGGTAMEDSDEEEENRAIRGLREAAGRALRQIDLRTEQIDGRWAEWARPFGEISKS